MCIRDRHIGFVMEPHKPGWTTINNKGEKLFYAFSFDNGPDYVCLLYTSAYTVGATVPERTGTDEPHCFAYFSR